MTGWKLYEGMLEARRKVCVEVVRKISLQILHVTVPDAVLIRLLLSLSVLRFKKFLLLQFRCGFSTWAGTGH